MKKLKLFIFTLLSVLTLGLFVVTGSKVNAETSKLIDSRSIGAVTTPNIQTANAAILTALDVETDSNNVYGWKSTDGGSSSQNNIAYRKYTDSSHSLRSPLLCASDKTTTANKVTVDVNVAFATKNASSFLVSALNASGTVLETKTVNIAAQSSSKTYVDAAQQVFTVDSGSIAYISLARNGADTYFGGVNISYYLTSDDSGVEYYTATYNLGSASGQIASSKVDQTADNKTIELPNPSEHNVTYANHTFAGWKLGDDIYQAGDEYTLDSDVEFVAQWTENAKYTVTYYVDGVQLTNVDAKYTSVYTGSSLEYYPTYADKAFDGWYTNTNYSVKVTTVTGNISVYGRTTELKTSLTQSDLTAETLSETKVHYAGTMFTLTSGLKIGTDAKTLPNETTSSYRINTSGSSYNSSTNIRTIDFKAPSDGKVVVYANTNTANKHVNLYNPSTQGVLSSYTTAEAATVYEIEFEVEKDNEYALGIDTNGSFYYVEFIPYMSKDGSVTVDAETNTNKSVLRFITTISGVELENVDKIELMIKKDAGDYKTVELTSVYESISGAKSEYNEDLAHHTYYGIFKLTNAQTIAGSTITFKAVVTYTDGSSVTMDAKSFVMPSAS